MNLEQIILEEAHYMLDEDLTIREIAKNISRSKSSVHKDLQIRLSSIDERLYQKVKRVLQKHIEIRHIRGGESTRQKYAKKV